MLTPAQVIPFLSHADPWVRTQALAYLIPSNDPSPATADDLWRAADAFDPDGRNQFMAKVPDLPQTENSVTRAIAALGDETYADYEEDLLDAIKAMDFQLIPRFLDQLRGLEDWNEEIVPHLEARLELAQKPPEEVWDSLIAYSDEMADGFWEDIDHDLVSRLIEALARHPVFAEPRVLEILSGRHRESSLEIWCIELAGRARLAAAVEPMLALLAAEDDGDAVSEETQRSLIQLGSPHVVEQIRDFMKSADWGPKLAAGAALGGIKLPEAERLLCDLLNTESNRTLLGLLASNLADLCPTDPSTLELLRSVVLKETYDEMEVNLPEQLAAVATMVGWTPPELEQWREDAAEAERETRELLEDPETLEEMVERLARRQFEREQPAKIPPPPENVPFRRETPKVGRNDPCPCGSGKKYKKCCGRGD